MTWLSLGSLALPFQLQRHGVALRGDIARLGVEVVTGLSSAPQRRLGGDLASLAMIESRLSRLDRYAETARAALAATGTAQTALTRLAQVGSDTSAGMLAASASGTSDTVLSAGRAARAAFGDAVGVLGARIAGRSLFSGAASDRAPLPSAESILGQLSPMLAGLSTADEVVSAIGAAFHDPGGLFNTVFYQGADTTAGAMIDDGEQAAVLPTAADPSIRRLLAGLATSAFVADPGLALATGQRAALARRAAEDLMGAAPGVTALQAGLGDAEARLDTRVIRLTGERDALNLARQTLIAVDPYEAATQLEQAQTQLQTLYAVTARTARLSLTGYL